MGTTIHKSDYIRDLLRYIENNIAGDLDAEFLSSISYVSLPKLYRDFYNTTGHSVKEYIRKRRLSNALALIKTSELELTDIAFNCGYSSYLTLWRAIKQTLNLAPSEYKDGNTYYFFPPLDSQSLQSVTVLNDTIPQTRCILYYDSKLLGIENTAIEYFLEQFPNYNGRIFGRNGKQTGNKFCYELYVTAIETDYSVLKLSGFKVAQEIPALTTTFATSTIRNIENEINAAWDYLYSDWLQDSMFEYTEQPYYEEYLLKNSKPTKLKLYLPIRKRHQDTKITLVENPDLCFITAKATGSNAEKMASGFVVDYVTKNYPHIVNSSKALFLQKNGNTYICGIQVNPGLPFIENEQVIRITTKLHSYLILESRVMGDYDRYVMMLLSFAKDNGMTADKQGIFAIYNTAKGIDSISIKMYCPVKIVIK